MRIRRPGSEIAFVAMFRISCRSWRQGRYAWSTSNQPIGSRIRRSWRRWPGPGDLIERHGREYEIWSGTGRVLLENVRFLAAYRRPGMVPEVDIQRAGQTVRDRDRLADTERRLAAGAPTTHRGGRCAHHPVSGMSRRCGPATSRAQLVPALRADYRPHSPANGWRGNTYTREAAHHA